MGLVESSVTPQDYPNPGDALKVHVASFSESEAKSGVEVEYLTS